MMRYQWWWWQLFFHTGIMVYSGSEIKINFMASKTMMKRDRQIHQNRQIHQKDQNHQNHQMHLLCIQLLSWVGCLSLNYGKYKPPYSSSSFPRRSSSSCFRGWHFYERVVPARSKSKRGPARLGGKAVRPKIFSHISVFSVFYLVVSTRRCTSNTSRSAPTSLGH